MIGQTYTRKDEYVNNRLREARVSNGISAEKFSRMTGINIPSIYAYERLRAFPSENVALKISEVLGKPVDYLFPESLRELTREVRMERKEMNEGHFGDGIGTVPFSRSIRRNFVSDCENPAVYADEGFLRDALIKYLGRLSNVQKEVISMRFGFNENCEEYTLEQIGEHLGVSGEYARQIERTALERLRRFIVPSNLVEHII
ncbi:MAG: sigma factor-like helix-turn-helix DNA-binding protein [Nanoarchaeota archaeon]